MRTGSIYRFNSSDGKAYVMYDAKEAEISCLAIDDDGNVFAATASADAARPGRTIPDKPGGTPEQGGDQARGRHQAASATSRASPSRASGRRIVPIRSPPAARLKHAAGTAKSVGKTTTEGGNAIYRIDPERLCHRGIPRSQAVVILAIAEHNGDALRRYRQRGAASTRFRSPTNARR